MIPVIGLLTVKFDWSFSQVVLMDKESLPTGIAIPRSIQKFDNASTPFLRFKSSIFSPHAAIQLADALIEEIDSMHGFAYYDRKNKTGGFIHGDYGKKVEIAILDSNFNIIDDAFEHGVKGFVSTEQLAKEIINLVIGD